MRGGDPGRREAIHTQATANAIRETGLTKEWVIEQLRHNAMPARELKQIAASNRALELLGREGACLSSNPR